MIISNDDNFQNQRILHLYSKMRQIYSPKGVCVGGKQSANKTHLSLDHQLEVDLSFFTGKIAAPFSFFVSPLLLCTKNIG